jgi:hypothetical protein
MENLNDKVWYRLLKVIFIFAFILVQGYIITTVWDSPPTKKFINCDNGKIFDYMAYNISSNDYWEKKCDPDFVPSRPSEGNFKNLLANLKN